MLLLLLLLLTGGEGRYELKNVVSVRRTSTTDFSMKIIENYILMASREKKTICEARCNFSSMLEEVGGGDSSHLQYFKAALPCPLR